MFTPQPSTTTVEYEFTAVGARRRLEALAAIGYPPTDLAAELNIGVGHFADALDPPPYKYREVAALFDRLQLAPGPSGRARADAVGRGWAAPLAWDEDTIDDPDAEPVGVPPRGYRRCNRTPADFVDMVIEARDLGWFDEDIAKSMGLKLRTLHKRLHRAGLPMRSRGLNGTAHTDKPTSAGELWRQVFKTQQRAS